MIKALFKIIKIIGLICLVVLVTVAFALYIEIIKSMSPKDNKIPDHIYNYELLKVPRTAEERERILRGDYTGIDFVTYDDIAVKVLDDKSGLIDRKLGDRPGHELNHWASGDQETWGSYTATLEDLQSWSIGPHGYQEPPEDFKIRISADPKGEVSDDYLRKFIDITRACWTVVVEIDGKRYGIQGCDLPGHNSRTVVSLNYTDDTITKELLLVDGKNKSDMITLLSIALGNDDLVKKFTGGAKIKNNIIDK